MKLPQTQRQSLSSPPTVLFSELSDSPGVVEQNSFTHIPVFHLINFKNFNLQIHEISFPAS